MHDLTKFLNNSRFTIGFSINFYAKVILEFILANVLKLIYGEYHQINFELGVIALSHLKVRM